MKQSSDEYGLIVAFVDESESFVNGFEAGEIWKDMQSGAHIDRTIHTANKEVIERMAVASGYEVDITKTDYEEWLNLEGDKTRPQPTNGNPNGLRVVK